MDYNITYRQKDGGWQYIISYKQDGKWRQRSKQGFRLKGDAKKAAQKRVKEIEKTWEIEKKLSPEYKGITFGEFKEMYIKRQLLYREKNTVEGIEFAVKHFEELDGVPMADIEPYHIQNCVDEMVRKKLLVTTIGTYLTRIKTLFNTAIKTYKIIEVNPASEIEIGKDKRDKKVRALTKAQLDTLLSKITNRRYYMMSLLASKCGLRVGEIVGLTWDREDPAKAEITIDRQWKKLSDGTNGMGPPKSRRSNRIVPEPAIVIQELARYKKEYPIHISGRMFPYKSTNSVSAALSAYYTRIGYPDLTIHDLRHTYAVTWLVNGVDYETIARYMGDTVEVIISTYSHFIEDMEDNAMKKVNLIF